MKNYLSFGGGVNSVAMYLLLLEQGVEFEAVFQDTGCEMPETYLYIEMFKKKYPLTVLSPREYPKGCFGLLEHCKKYSIVPTMMFRWCTDKFKITPLSQYVEKPCFMMLGIDWGESHRAKLNSNKGIENRFPLIEAEIDREGCKEIIKNKGLPVPVKSGCFICPYQSVRQWKELRMNHPDLFCKAEQLEKRNMEYRISKGKKPLYLYGNAKPLRVVVDENQTRLFKQDEYPPCECML